MTADPTRLDRLAVKSGVSLGLLSPADRDAVLAFAALHLPASADHDERGVDAVLRSFLASGGAMLRTDHVELRRWLVDARWLERDGFGRCYRLPADAPARAAALLGDVSADALDARVAAVRDAHAAERQARRARHAVAQGSAGVQVGG